MPLWMSVLILEAEQVQACSVLEWDSASFFFGVGWGGNDIHKHRGLTDIQYPCKKKHKRHVCITHPGEAETGGCLSWLDSQPF